MGIDLEKVKKSIHEFETVKDENGLTRQDKWFIKQEKKNRYRQYQMERFERFMVSMSKEVFESIIKKFETRRYKNITYIASEVFDKLGEYYDDGDGGDVIFKGMGYFSIMGSTPMFRTYTYYIKPTPIKQRYNGIDSVEIRIGYEKIPYYIHNVDGLWKVSTPYDMKDVSDEAPTDYDGIINYVIEQYKSVLETKKIRYTI